MPELTEGPYYLDLDLVRSDIAEGRPGLPLDLRVAVVDADACEPIEGAAVDVWHCDARGRILRRRRAPRGDLLPRRAADRRRRPRRVRARSSRAGTPGRAVHIHVKVQVDGDQPTRGSSSSTRDDVGRLRAGAVRRARRAGRRNSSDSIYGQSGGVTVVAVDVGAESPTAPSPSAWNAPRHASGSPRGAARPASDRRRGRVAGLSPTD